MYSRDDAHWEQLTEAGHEFLVERARNRGMTSYTELNGQLVERTGLPGFDFHRADERAAMGHLLALIVERDLPVTGLMISALVRYLGTNEAGPGFYGLAVQLGLIPKGASRAAKEEFWVSQVGALHEHYAPAGT